MASGEEFFVNLSTQIGGLTTSFINNSITTSVTAYKGDPGAFREWIQNVDKYALLNSLDDTNKRKIAFQTA